MKKLILFFLIFYSLFGFSQSDNEDSARKVKENDLHHISNKIFAAKTDVDKLKYNKQLLEKFDSLLNEPGSFEHYQFDSLRKDMPILISPDNKFRIITWEIEKSDGTHEYFGFVQSKHTDVKKKGFRKIKTETVQLFPLIDKSPEIKNPENAISDNKKWFGMLYYSIILTKSKSKDYYTLLGKDNNDKYSQKKIIDVLTFDNTGVPHFGADIFNFQKRYPKRVIFEYSATCSMSLRYNSKKDSIVFGHLAPIEPQLEGQYQYYCSDMSFDGFGFKKGKWNYGTDINAVNEKDEKDKLYGNPRDKSSGSNNSNNYQTVMDQNAPTGNGNKVVKKEKKKKKR
jgi:hypothetical protein